MTDLFGSESIDDGGFANVWVADKPNRNKLLVRAQPRKLAQQAEQAALAKRVGD